MTSHVEKLCSEKNIKLTENRKIIAKVISDSTDHPDVEEVFSCFKNKSQNWYCDSLSLCKNV